MKMTVAELIEIAIALSEKTQREIASEIGYPRPNIISMFKAGVTKLPYRKVPLLAEALGIDPAGLLRKCLEEYDPEILAVIEPTLGDILTTQERQAVEILREIRAGRTTPLSERELGALGLSGAAASRR